jgi:hypothetical protein
MPVRTRTIASSHALASARAIVAGIVEYVGPPPEGRRRCAARSDPQDQLWSSLPS